MFFGRINARGSKGLPNYPFLLQYDAEYIVRVSFGTALFASIVLVYAAIIVILSSKRYNGSQLIEFLQVLVPLFLTYLNNI